MERYLSEALRANLGRKILLLSGPRQVGKTTLVKGLDKDAAYYNYDIRKDSTIFRDQQWDRSTRVVIFDELHKMKKWKLWLKGLYDEGAFKTQSAVVTGSAKLELASRVGDSLAGRYFHFRLHPLDLKELKGQGKVETNYQRLIRVGGFPEPYIEGTDKFYGLWRQTHTQAIIRQDLLSTANIRDLEGIELLIDLLAKRVGSTISYNSLSEDLDRDDKTIKHWIRILESLYVGFRITPHSKNIARALKKASKFYFYDLGRVDGDESQKFENLVALALKKEIDYLQDTEGKECSLNFVQTTDKREIDFIVRRASGPIHLFEVKLSDDQPSKNFERVRKYFQGAKQVQLVRNLDRRFSTRDDIHVEPALPYLENLKI